jgi:hypothetical protein
LKFFGFSFSWQKGSKTKLFSLVFNFFFFLFFRADRILQGQNEGKKRFLSFGCFDLFSIEFFGFSFLVFSLMTFDGLVFFIDERDGPKFSRSKKLLSFSLMRVMDVFFLIDDLIIVKPQWVVLTLIFCLILCH